MTGPRYPKTFDATTHGGVEAFDQPPPGSVESASPSGPPLPDGDAGTSEMEIAISRAIAADERWYILHDGWVT